MIGPVDSSQVPRYAGPATFARLPRLADVTDADIAVWGVPYDGGVSYRPGARFGPNHVRQSSRLLPGFAKRGVVPESGGTWYLPRLVGTGRAFEMMATGRLVAAEDPRRGVDR